MTDADDELDALREQGLEVLKARATGDTDVAGEADTSEEPDEASDEPIEVESPDHFRALLDRHAVALVDCYVDWCGPCQMLEPVVAELAKETAAAVLKVDVDAHQALASDLRVQGVPTLLVYADGELVERVVGVAQKSELRSLIESAR